MKAVCCAMLLAFIGMSSIGCTSVRNLSDDDLAASLEDGARLIVIHGLDMAIDKFKDKKDEILRDSKAVNDSIKKDLIPLFSGATAGEVTVAVAQDILTKINTKVPETIRSVILAAATLVQGMLPQKPADKIPERTRKAILGVIRGVSSGIDTVLADETPSTVPSQ